MTPIPGSLAEILAAVEAKKARAIRERLGIPESLQIAGIQLEALNYHLTERSGAVEVRLEAEGLRVSEPGSSSGFVYTGDAVDFLLAAWGMTRESARRGARFELRSGKLVA